MRGTRAQQQRQVFESRRVTRGDVSRHPVLARDMVIQEDDLGDPYALALARKRADARAEADAAEEAYYLDVLRNAAQDTDCYSITAEFFLRSYADAGVHPGTTYETDDNGNDWVLVTTVTETVAARDWEDSSMVLDTLYFSHATGLSPVVDEGDPAMQSPRVHAQWFHLELSKNAAIRFTNVEVVDCSTADGAYANMLLGARDKHVAPSRYLVMRRGDMAPALAAAAAGGGFAPAPAPVGPRRCVPQWLLSTYGPMLSSMRASGAAAQRRFVDMAAERALTRNIADLDGDASVDSRDAAASMQATLDAGVPLVEMTYGGLYRFWFGDDAPPYVEGDDMLVTLAQLRAWFVAHHTKLVVLGPDDRALAAASYVPPGGRSRLPVGAVKVVDGHVYPLNLDLARLHRVEGARAVIEDASALFGPAHVGQARVGAPRVPAAFTCAMEAEDGDGDADAATDPAHGASAAPRADAHFGVDARPPRVFVEDLRELLTTPLCSGSYASRGDRVYVADVTGDFDLTRVYWELRVRGIHAGIRTCDNTLTGITLRVAVEARDVVDPHGTSTAATATMTAAAAASAAPEADVAAPDGGDGGDATLDVDVREEANLYGNDARGEDGGDDSGPDDDGDSGAGARRRTDAKRRAATKTARPTSCELRLLQIPTPRGELAPAIKTKAAYAAYTSMFARVRDACMPVRARSTYAPLFGDALRHMGWVGFTYGAPPATAPAPFSAVSTPAAGAPFLAVDGNRMYTSCLHAVATRGLPVFTAFDEFEACGNDVVAEPLAFYTVVRSSPVPAAAPVDGDGIPLLNILLERDTCVVPGATLALARSHPQFAAAWSVRSVVRPSRVVPGAPVLAALTALYNEWADVPADTAVDTLRKDIVNKVVGLLGKVDAASEWSYAFETVGEAAAWAETVPGASRPWALLPPRRPRGADGGDVVGDMAAEEPPVWVVTLRSSAPLVDGFRPVWAHVVSECRRRVFELARASAPRPVVGIKTDCVWFPALIDDAPVPKASDLASVIAGTWSRTLEPATPAPMGDRLLVAAAAAAEAKLRAVGAAAASPPPDPVDVVETVQDEHDVSQLVPLFEAGRLNLQADAPGCGKTRAWINWITETSRVGLLVCPYNALCLAVNREQYPGVSACTAFDVLGLRLTDDGGCESKAARDISGVDAILWDEVALYDTAMLARIFKFEARAEAARASGADGSASGSGRLHFHYTSDFHQLGPIEDTVFADDDYASMAYYSRILRRHCPRVLTLHVVKRVSTEEDRLAVRALLDAMWGTLEEQAAGVVAEWTPERRRDVLRLPIFRRRVADVAAIPNGARAVTYYRQVASAMGRALHAISPAMAAGHEPPASAAPPLPPPPPPAAPPLPPRPPPSVPLPPPATQPPTRAKRQQPSGHWKRTAKRMREQGLTVPPWVPPARAPLPPSPPLAGSTEDDLATQAPPWLLQSDDEGDNEAAPSAAAPAAIVPRAAAQTGVFSAYVEHQRVRCTKQFKTGPATFHVNYEYELVRLDDAAALAHVRPADTFAGTFTLAVSPTRLKTHFAYVGGQTAHSLQGASVDAPLLLCDVYSPRVSRRWLTTAATRARDMSKLMVWTGKLPAHAAATTAAGSSGAAAAGFRAATSTARAATAATAASATASAASAASAAGATE